MSANDPETLAETFAAQGRDELLSRFRAAYADALGAQADLVSFDADHLERMVQRAVEDADGLQWRRALAGVAARELDIELGAALTHPAVVRAHQLLPAPTYESALAALAVPAPIPATPPTPPAAVAVAPGREDVTEAALTETPGGETSAREPIPAHESEATEAERVDTADTVSADVEAVAAAELAAVMPDMEPRAPVEAEPEPPVAADPERLIDVEPTAGVAPAEDDAGLEDPYEDDFTFEHDVVEAPEQPSLLSDPDQPTMTYAAVGVPAPDADAPVDEPSDPDPSETEPPTTREAPPPRRPEALSHRAADFAEEFMADGASAPSAPADVDADAEDLEGENDPFTSGDDAGDPVPDTGTTEFGAVHLGGVASLPAPEEIAVRLSGEGLDLIQPDGVIVGRLTWTDIAALEVTVPHGRRRRRASPRLVVHTAAGSARFDVPGVSGEELQERVAPIMERYRR